MFKRHIQARLLEALADTPVVLLVGARQTGKSTLVRHLADSVYPARYLTLDDATTLAAARHDPTGFLAGLEGPVIIDEVQRAPELFLAIKSSVDRQRQPGRFLLTGSANVMLLPRLADALAGRMEILTLWPLSQGEIEGAEEDFIDRLFAKELRWPAKAALDRTEVIERVLRGGYPEVLQRETEDRRRAWFGAYLTTILQRDVREIANIEGLTDLPRLLALLATRTSSLLNLADLSRSIVIPQTTLKRYMSLLEATFLVQPLPAWSAHLGKRLVKAPKLVLNDTGLLAYLLGVNGQRLAEDRTLLGGLLEDFVVMELRKQASWSATGPRLFHFRTPTGHEVDIVLENAAGRLVGVEVKSSASVTADDFKGLRALQELTGRRFLRGVVLYTGSERVPFGPHQWALPITDLWQRVSNPKTPRR